MSFGSSRKFTESFEKEIKKAIHRAEKNGKDIAYAENKGGFDSYGNKELVGQILHWKVEKHYRKPDDWHKYTKAQREFLCKRPKKIWKIVGIKPAVYYPDDKVSSNIRKFGGKAVKTPEKLILEPYKGTVNDYLPNKKIIITQKEFNEQVDGIGLGLLKEGRYCIKDDGSYGRITKIYIKEIKDEELTNEDHRNNPHCITIMKDEIWVDYLCEKNKRIDTTTEEPEFDSSGSCRIKEFMDEWQIIPEDNIKIFEEKMNYVEETGKLPFDDVLQIGDSRGESEKETTNALMGFDSQKYLQKTHMEMAVRKNEADIIKSSMTRKVVLKKEEMEMALEKKKMGLAAIMNKLNDTVAIFKKEMSKIYRLIATLEIYMGVDERIIQIAEGEPAPEDCPISLRQMLLYMDEECAEFLEMEGLDHRYIEKFDQWLVDSGKYDRLVPEEKCVVVMRPRRYMKHYSDDPIIQTKMENRDKLIYILIRNGNNLYRIWTDNIPYTDRMFPKKAELQKMMDEIHELQKEREKVDSGYAYDKITDKLDEADKEMFSYKRNMLLLQGIIMRTPIFAPLPEGLNVLDVRTHGDHLNFIYDEEDVLSDGRPRFKEWLHEINKSIKKGSRIYFASSLCPSPNTFPRRFSLQWEHDLSAPDLPNSGVYEVIQKKEYSNEYHEEWIPLKEFEKAKKKWEEILETVSHFSNHHRQMYEIPREDHVKYHLYQEASGWNKKTRRTRKGVKQILVNKYDPEGFEKEIGYYSRKSRLLKKDEYKNKLKISYNPKDEVYNMYTKDSGERKTNITMIIKPEEDEFIIHYDVLLLEDIEYYLENRIDRPNYLKMMPILRGLKERLQQEQEQEKNFVNALKDRMLVEEPKLEGFPVEDLIWECVKWWKEQVVTVWKRPINKDDKKAMEMITKRVKSQAKKRFKIKNLDAGFDNTKKVLCWRHPEIHSWIIVGYGLTKKEFIELIASEVTLKRRFDSNYKKDKKFSKAEVSRKLFELKENDFGYKEAKESKGIIVHMDAN